MITEVLTEPVVEVDSTGSPQAETPVVTEEIPAVVEETPVVVEETPQPLPEATAGEAVEPTPTEATPPPVEPDSTSSPQAAPIEPTPSAE